MIKKILTRFVFTVAMLTGYGGINHTLIKKNAFCACNLKKILSSEARLIILFSYHFRIFTAHIVSFLLKIILWFRITFVSLRLISYHIF